MDWFNDSFEAAVVSIFFAAILGILASGIMIGITLMKLFE